MIRKQLKIVSGGQTGADRTALEWAIAHDVAHGGWCPRGRLAEDGLIADRYRLVETVAQEYAQRTEWNVRDSDGTVIFSISPELSGGSRFTEDLAAVYQKPCLHLFQEDIRDAAAKLGQFIREDNIRVLNVAGPRASNEPDVATFVHQVLDQWWNDFAKPV